VAPVPQHATLQARNATAAPARRRLTRVDRDIQVEGRSSDPEIGHFAGSVHTISSEEDAEGRNGRPLEYLVIDSSRWIVFWAKEGEISRISDAAGGREEADSR
jgi:hypothetical protein